MGDIDDIVVKLLGDGTSYQRMITGAIGDTDKFAKTVNLTSGSVNGLTSTLGGFGGQVQGIMGMLAGSLGLGGMLSTVFSAISKAAETEQTEIAFRSLIGNAELAMDTLKDLRAFAVATPFEVPQILAAAKQMLGYGQSAEEILPTMKKLGDVAAGLSIPLGSLTYLYGTLKSSGRVMTIDMRQFANRGIPIWLETAKVLGMVSKETKKLTKEQSATLAQMTSKGKITFDMIEQAFTNMSAKGGLFFNMMEDQSHSFNGLISNLKDSLGLLLADIGKQIIEGFDLKRVVLEIGAAAQAFAKWFKEMDPATKKMIFTIAGVVVALGVLIASFLVLKGILITIGFIIGTVGLPFLIIIGLIVAGISMWVNEVGGLGKAMDIVKAKAIEFWEWLLPIRQALVAVFQAVWDLGVTAWNAFKKAAVDVWRSLTGQVQVDWNSIRDYIVNNILYAAFTISHFGEWATAAFAKAKIAAIDYAETLVQVQGPVAVALYNMMRPFDGIRSKAEKELEGVMSSFEEFKKKAMVITPESILPPKEKAALEKKADEAGKAVGQKMKEKIQKELDTLIFGSAENLRRLDDYLEKINAPIRAVVGPGGMELPLALQAGRPKIAGDVPEIFSPDPKVRVEPEELNGESSIDVLKQIRDRINPDRQPIEVDGAEADIAW